MPIRLLTMICFVFFGTTRVNFGEESAADAETSAWGTLTGQFVYAGDPPPRKLLELNKDIEFCMPRKPLDQELIVDPKTRGLKNVVLWLEPNTADGQIPVHPDYEKTAENKVRLDNLDCQFVPHICVLRTTQTLVIGNKDTINHNAAMFFFKNDPFNENIPQGETVEKKLPLSERLPAKVTCPIHAWMIGYILVKDHPYVAITDDVGKFELKNLPAGKWTLRVWHEKTGYIKAAMRAGQLQEWEAGRAAIDIQPGNNAWGEMKLAPELFQK